jgi:DNA-binding MarR family transcriptional regulator
MSTDESHLATGDEWEAAALWTLWKRVHEVVRGSVIADVTAVAQVSDSELGVLVHLDIAGGVLRQNALAAATGWDRTRLSHLLTRMESRGYLARRKVAGGVELVLSESGARILDASRPPLEAAARRHFLDKLDAGDVADLRRILGRLLG